MVCSIVPTSGWDIVIPTMFHVQLPLSFFSQLIDTENQPIDKTPIVV